MGIKTPFMAHVYTILSMVLFIHIQKTIKDLCGFHAQQWYITPSTYNVMHKYNDAQGIGKIDRVNHASLVAFFS